MLPLIPENSESWNAWIWREIMYLTMRFRYSANSSGRELTSIFLSSDWKVDFHGMLALFLDNSISELGLLQLCILLEEGYLPNLVEVEIDNNKIDENSLGYKTLMQLLQKNMLSSKNISAEKVITTYRLSDQHLSINSKVILQMFTKLTAKWNQLSRQMKFVWWFFYVRCCIMFPLRRNSLFVSNQKQVFRPILSKTVIVLRFIQKRNGWIFISFLCNSSFYENLSRDSSPYRFWR